MICVSGYSGSGKDMVCGQLIRAHGAVQTGLADPAKRHMADVYGFTEHQLFGPSAARNVGDLRYPKAPITEGGFKLSESSAESPPDGLIGQFLPDVKYWEAEGRGVWGGLNPPMGVDGIPYVQLRLGNVRAYVPEGDPRFWLSPREALQKYCNLMNMMYLRTWSRKGVDIHRQLAKVRARNMTTDGENVLFHYSYSRMKGLVENDHHESRNQGLWVRSDGTRITCFADIRHWHELAEANDAEGLMAVLIRVKRPSVPEPPYDHRSETEQAQIDDFYFDFVLDNDGTLEELYAKVDDVIVQVKEKGWEPTRDRRP